MSIREPWTNTNQINTDSEPHNTRPSFFLAFQQANSQYPTKE